MNQPVRALNIMSSTHNHHSCPIRGGTVARHRPQAV